MTEQIYIIAMIILGVLEVIFTVGFFLMLKKINDLKCDYEFFRNIQKLDNEYFNKITEQTVYMKEAYDKMVDLMERYGENHDKMVSTMLDSSQHVIDGYKIITEQHRKLLDVWKRIDERYDNTYEQFKHCTDELKKLNEDYIREHIFVEKEAS